MWYYWTWRQHLMLFVKAPYSRNCTMMVPTVTYGLLSLTSIQMPWLKSAGKGQYQTHFPSYREYAKGQSFPVAFTKSSITPSWICSLSHSWVTLLESPASSTDMCRWCGPVTHWPNRIQIDVVNKYSENKRYENQAWKSDILIINDPNPQYPVTSYMSDKPIPTGKIEARVFISDINGCESTR